MLLGYDEGGEIKFIFTDSTYLEKMYPKNTAKISNFWGSTHNLKELFVDKIEGRIDDYRVVDGQLVKKEVK